MATKPNPAPLPAGEAENTEPKAAPPKRSLVGRLFGVFAVLNPLTFLKLRLMQKLIVVTALVIVIGGGGSAYYFLGLSAGEENADGVAGEPHAPASNLPPANAAFFDVPDMVVNIQTADATPAYLKLAVALELDNEEAKAAIEPVMPRVVDQFQTYLRELRVEDVRGSMGVMRLKEELLRRVNLAVAPTPVRDVLLKEMIVQ